MSAPTPSSSSSCKAGFTLLELLVVLGIIGALAAISMPMVRGFGQGNALAAAERQVADDIALARQYAIKNRSVVYLVFAVPKTPIGAPNPFQSAATDLTAHLNELKAAGTTLAGFPELQNRALRAFTNIFGGMFTSYALFTEQSVGEQPGVRRPRYLLDWRELPEGIVFPTNMNFYIPPGRVPEFPQGQRVELPRRQFPFPIAPRLGDPENAVPKFPVQIPPNSTGGLPYLAFDPTGRLVTPGATPQDQYLAIGFGSVLVPRLPNPGKKGPGTPDPARPLDYVETPRENYTNSIFRIAALTGRSKLFKPETK